MAVKADMRGFYKDLKFEEFTFEELSFLRDLAEQELNILGLRDRLVEHDSKNPVANSVNSENIIMAQKFFPSYKKALLGIKELVARHIAPFEADYNIKKEEEEKQRKIEEEKLKKEQVARNKKKEEEEKLSADELATRRKKEELEKKLSKEKEQGITHLFGLEEGNKYLECMSEIALQKDSDY